MALDATVAGEDANSYVTAEEAETYFGERLRTEAWDDAPDADQEKALLMACRHIEACRLDVNRRPPGTGLAILDPLSPLSATQRLSFPRQRDLDQDGDHAVPQPVKDAQCEEALALLSQGGDAERRRQLQAQGVRSFSVDGLSETYDASGASGASQYPLVSQEAMQLLLPYMRMGAVLATSDYPDGELSPGSD
jgi:hypothetical protein